LHAERFPNPPPILLGARTLEKTNSIHLFANSDLVKQQLEIEISASRCIGDRVHPVSLELRAAVSSITFFECVAAEHHGRWGTPRVIEHDNWQRIFWTFVRLFETRSGFLARWENGYDYMKEFWEKEPPYHVDELCIKSLPDDCGKSYAMASGKVLLEYVNRI
jgi:hypothetical protein